MCLSEKFVKVITEFEVHKSILENDTDNWHWDIYILSFRTSRIKKKKLSNQAERSSSLSWDEMQAGPRSPMSANQCQKVKEPLSHFSVK